MSEGILIGIASASPTGEWRMRSGGKEIPLLLGISPDASRLSDGDIIVCPIVDIFVDTRCYDVASDLRSTSFSVSFRPTEDPLVISFESPIDNVQDLICYLYSVLYLNILRPRIVLRNLTQSHDAVITHHSSVSHRLSEKKSV